jgi:hypothetical protein
VVPIALLAIAASGVAPGCPAPAVHTDDNALLPAPFNHESTWFSARANRLYAVMWSGRAVDGRFSVYAHGFDPVTHINEKIMWVVPPRAKRLAGTRLRIDWIKDGRVRRVQRFGDKRQWVRYRHETIYPSILDAPSTGCWQLRLRTGRVRATIHVLVQPQPRKQPQQA